MNGNIGVETLLGGIGEISDELITEASEEEIVKRKKISARRRIEFAIGGMAACLVLAVTVMFAYHEINIESEGVNRSEPGVTDIGNSVIKVPEAMNNTERVNTVDTYVDRSYGAGMRFIGENGSLAYVGYTPTEIKLLLELKTAQSEMCISLRKADGLEAAADTHGVSDLLALKVNGERADALPTAPGCYELVLDISALNADGDMYPFFHADIFGGRIALIHSGMLTVVESNDVIIKGPESFTAEVFADIPIDGDEILY